MSIEERFDDFMAHRNLLAVIAFSGGSDDKSDALNQTVDECIKYLSDYRVAVLTGGTNFGLPKTATLAARKYKIPTIGVFPSRGEKYFMKDEIDLGIMVEPRFSGSEFGDESEIFVKLSNAIVSLGGSNGTGIEFYHAMKINDRRKKYYEMPIILAPIIGFGGFVDGIKGLEVTEQPIYNGRDAAKLVIDKLGLNLADHDSGCCAQP
jgi:predicted Rossmann-fold nucleotide-binding protein